MVHWRNDLPGLMILQACCKVLITDSSSLHVQTLRGSHSVTIRIILLQFVLRKIELAL